MKEYNYPKEFVPKVFCDYHYVRCPKQNENVIDYSNCLGCLFFKRFSQTGSICKFSGFPLRKVFRTKENEVFRSWDLNIEKRDTKTIGNLKKDLNELYDLKREAINNIKFKYDPKIEMIKHKLNDVQGKHYYASGESLLKEEFKKDVLIVKNFTELGKLYGINANSARSRIMRWGLVKYAKQNPNLRKYEYENYKERNLN